MKRYLSGVLILCLLCALLPLSALAADSSRAYEFELTADGSHEVQVLPGDVLTVVLTLTRTDRDESADMYAMQDEIGYDSNFFELVDGSAMTYADVASTDIALRDGSRSFYLNFLSTSGGVAWGPKVQAGSFQLRVLAESGTSTLKNTNFLVSLADGSDTYAATCQDLTVVVSTDCTVRFESNGGAAVPDQTVRYGETVAEPDEPARAGYDFNGWYSDLDRTMLWNFQTDPVKGNMTLYAGWTAAELAADTAEQTGGGFPWWIPGAVLVAALLLLLLLLAKKTVTFETDGGTELEPLSVKRGSLLEQPMTPQKPGAVFGGWYRDRAGTLPWNFKEDKVERSVTLYARWS
ncbi:MAG: InlB B-repeat-containing protein [Oscillospiraceae bacterium]|nr:InlB B-repeat-containing protein [Oscillospiraceae bacterium]